MLEYLINVYSKIIYKTSKICLKVRVIKTSNKVLRPRMESVSKNFTCSLYGN